MKALVTGGAGFIGSHIVDALLQKGYEVRILDSLVEPVHPNRQVPKYLTPDAELIVGDIRDKRLVAKALQGVSVVFHEAAHQGYMPDYSTYFDVNSVGTALLFETIVENKYDLQKMIIASSQAVYGEGRYICPEHGEYQENPRSIAKLRKGIWEHVCPICKGSVKNKPAEETFIAPNTQYAMSKYTQELIGLNLGKRHQIPVVNLRYSITLGKRQSVYNMYQGILRSFTAQLKLGRPPVIYEDGLMRRDYIHIDDVVNANMCVLESPEADYQSFNVGTGISTTTLEFFQLVAKCMKVDIKPIVGGEFRTGDVRHIVSSPANLLKLGWKPVKTMESMINDYLGYLDKVDGFEYIYESALLAMRKSQAIQEVS